MNIRAPSEFSSSVTSPALHDVCKHQYNPVGRLHVYRYVIYLNQQYPASFPCREKKNDKRNWGRHIVFPILEMEEMRYGSPRRPARLMRGRRRQQDDRQHRYPRHCWLLPTHCLAQARLSLHPSCFHHYSCTCSSYFM